MREQFTSIFDIVGPVMIGPSSSHTAGAARIGGLARRILGQPVQRAHITLYESFALTGHGHGTDLALLGGLLGLASYDLRLAQAAHMASEQGLEVTWEMSGRSPVNHPNTVRLELQAESADITADVLAVSRGGGKVEVVDVDGFPVSMSGAQPTLLVFHQDKAGAVAQVSTSLALGRSNIAHMEVARSSKGKNALMVIELDQAPAPEVLAEIAGLAVVSKVRFCPSEETFANAKSTEDAKNAADVGIPREGAPQ